MIKVLTIMSINICAVSTYARFAALENFLRQQAVDICLLQEVVVHELPRFPHMNVYTNVGDRGRGTAIVTRAGIEIIDIKYHPSGRIISGRVGDVAIINVYAHSGSQARNERTHLFTNEILHFIPPNCSQIILGGDFNCVIRPDDHDGGPYPTNAALAQLIAQLQLLDVACVLNVPFPHYTYVTAHSKSRLDRFYITNQYANKLHRYDVIPVHFSDHYAVLFTCEQFTTVPRHGRGFWRLNTQLLNVDFIANDFRHNWTNWCNRKHNYPSPALWWELCVKPNVCSLFKKHAYWSAEERRQTREYYNMLLRELQQQVNRGYDLTAQIRTVKQKLLDIDMAQLNRRTILLRDKSVTAEERYSLFTLVKERKQIQKQTIAGLYDNDGILHSDQHTMSRIVSNHYSELYSEHNVDPNSLNTVLRECDGHIDPARVDMLTRDCDDDEISRIITKLPSRRSPGPDGIPYEFYKTFWDTICADFCEVVRDILTRRELCASHKRGIIVLIPKTRTPKRPEEFRPISLLCTDYKIIMRLCAARLTSALPDILGQEQTCGVQGKSIIHGIQALRDVQLLITIRRMVAAFLNIDLDKAFDRVNHKYLLAVMRHYKFPRAAVEWVQMIQTGATSRIQLNGFLSPPIAIHSSVRQGCPLSMLLFTIAIEPLCRLLSSKLQGLKISNHVFKLNAYADDITCLIQSQKELKDVSTALELFQHASNLRANVQKTSFLCLCPAANNATLVQGRFRPVDSVKLLGIYFLSDATQMASYNWQLAVTKLRAQQILFNIRGTNLITRACLINTFVLSRLWYLAHFFPLPRQCQAQILKYVGWIIWKSYIFKTARPQLYLSIADGGLGLLDHEKQCTAIYQATAICTAIRDDVYAVLQSATWNEGARLVQPYRMARDALSTLVANLPDGLVVTSKTLYRRAVTKDLTPKVALQNPRIRWARSWRAVGDPYLKTNLRSAAFTLYNDLVPTALRRYNIHLTDDPICPLCGNIDTAVHRITSCIYAVPIWRWCVLRLRHQISETGISDERLLQCDFYMFPSVRRRAAHWLIFQAIHFLLTNTRPVTLADFISVLREDRWNMARRGTLRTWYDRYLFFF